MVAGTEEPSLPLFNFTYTRKQLVGSKATLVTVPAEQRIEPAPAQTSMASPSSSILLHIKKDLDRRRKRISNMGYLDQVGMMSDGRNSHATSTNAGSGDPFTVRDVSSLFNMSSANKLSPSPSMSTHFKGISRPWHFLKSTAEKELSLSLIRSRTQLTDEPKDLVNEEENEEDDVVQHRDVKVRAEPER